jgi:hypothetical protein
MYGKDFIVTNNVTNYTHQTATKQKSNIKETGYDVAVSVTSKFLKRQTPNQWQRDICLYNNLQLHACQSPCRHFVMHFLIFKKVKLSLCLTKHHAMKTYWWNGSRAPRILVPGTRWR